MSFIVLRSYLIGKNILPTTCTSLITSTASLSGKNIFRKFSHEGNGHFPDYSCTTIIVENKSNVQELPVIIRKTKDLSELEKKHVDEKCSSNPDSVSYNLIQDEFRQCANLRDVFSLLSKCTKITPNIALGAMERIYDLEKRNNQVDRSDSQILSLNVAKGAIVDKLLQVVIRTEDTQTILNALICVASVMDPYKYKFCDELLIRVLDSKLSVEQLCQFTIFLAENVGNNKYSEIIDKLWVGFVEKEGEINEKNIVNVCGVLTHLKISKKTILTLLEVKLSELWTKINVNDMLLLLNTLSQDKCLSVPSFTIASRWLYTNIHALDEDSLLDVVTKFTSVNYNDHLIEKAVEKYVKLKRDKIQSPMLMVGILNYCSQFQLRNDILNECAKYFIRKGKDIPSSFLKSFIYPYGYLYFDPKIPEFWEEAENMVLRNFDKIPVPNMCAIVMSFIYIGRNPAKLISKIYSAEYLADAMKLKPEAMKLHLIDTALSLQCDDYLGPRLPKNHWNRSCVQDVRIKKMLEKVKDIFIEAVGDANKISFEVLIPNLCSDRTYLIDVMYHPVGLGSATFNWKLKSERNEIIAILIHLPDQYCSDGITLIGPQQMKKRHLKILGMKAVSIKYSEISKFYTSFNKTGLKEYLVQSIGTAEPCT